MTLPQRIVPSLAFLLFLAADTPPPLSNGEAKTPAEERATFQLAPGFRIDAIATEPNVIDPVAFAFDERGRLFVAEMRGYPNGGLGTGDIASGVIKRLEDKDGDGIYETATVFAKGLRFPTSVMPYRGGLLVAVAPDILYFTDTNDDGVADSKRVLYTGFDTYNIQQLVNGLQWGLDNWVYAMAGNGGGTITSPEKPDMPAVVLRGRGIRFHPDIPGSLEPTTGGGQFGLSPDEGQRYFTATNSQHLRHIVIPDQYLRRNPYLAVGSVTLDIPEHGAACQVFRISPFEAWRVERTTRRVNSELVKRLSKTEQVPGGFATSACSPLYYAADRFPESHRGTVFVCDPANNLITRDTLTPSGGTFVARRADAGKEFLASTDNWFRPVFLGLGPDAGLFVADFYREAIETPLSLPDDIKARLNLESRSRGRIWRITPEDGQAWRPVDLAKAKPAELVEQLADANLWTRLTAQRLLIERQDLSVVPRLVAIVEGSLPTHARMHALWTLDGLGSVSDTLLGNALRDDDPAIREQALRIAEPRMDMVPTQPFVVRLASDPSPRVRFQAALSLGYATTDYRDGLVPALAQLLMRPDSDRWTQLAVLSSSTRWAGAMLERLTTDADFVKAATPEQLQALGRLAEIIGARAEPSDLARAFTQLGAAQPTDRWAVVVLEGLGRGLQNGGQSLRKLWDTPPADLKNGIARVQPFFAAAAKQAGDDSQPVAARLAAVRLLGYGPFSASAGVWPALLAPSQPSDLQLAAVRALAGQDRPEVPQLLLGSWAGYSPAVRREVLEALFARADRLPALLDAVEAKTIPAAGLDPARLLQLRKLPDAKLRERAEKALAAAVAPDRKKVLADYDGVLDLTANADRGREVFRKNCMTCHRLENQGVQVGPDLAAAIGTKTPADLLVAILDPSREVDPRYVNYLVTTSTGRVLTGIISAETPASLTLRRAEGAEDTILRTQIDEVQATAQSLMPEGIEKQVGRQEMADLIAYLRQAVAK